MRLAVLVILSFAGTIILGLAVTFLMGIVASIMAAPRKRTFSPYVQDMTPMDLTPEERARISVRRPNAEAIRIVARRKEDPHA